MYALMHFYFTIDEFRLMAIGNHISWAHHFISNVGSRIEYVVATAWGELLVFDPDARTPRPRDAAVSIAFDPDAVIVLPR